jgi:prepilin-type N-terminal cleavage/methylation domain-containing protein
MKRLFLLYRKSRSSGFTLVEMLVVIGIIAILAGVLFPAGNAAIKAAKRAKANATISQIQTAVLAYYTEYSVYPVPSTTTADVYYSDTDNTDWPPLIGALSGNVYPADGSAYSATSTQPTNTRSIAFLNLKSSDVFTASDVASNANAVANAPKNPLPGSTSANLYYNIVMDSNYDGILGTASPTNVMPNFSTSVTGSISTGGTSTAGVALWGNCNNTTTASSQNPAFYVHTY